MGSAEVRWTWRDQNSNVDLKKVDVIRFSYELTSVMWLWHSTK